MERMRPLQWIVLLVIMAITTVRQILVMDVILVITMLQLRRTTY